MQGGGFDEEKRKVRTCFQCVLQPCLVERLTVVSGVPEEALLVLVARCELQDSPESLLGRVWRQQCGGDVDVLEETEGHCCQYKQRDQTYLGCTPACC
jgi:hypothetical protein